jgi:hypothetical protein
MAVQRTSLVSSAATGQPPNTESARYMTIHEKLPRACPLINFVNGSNGLPEPVVSGSLQP